MDRVKTLQIKKLLKELDFIETDYQYRSEIVSEVDCEFMNSINDFLSKNPELKTLYDSKINERIEKTLEKEKTKSSVDGEGEKCSVEIDNKSKNKSEKSNETKKAYRDIVKMTHPDKVSDPELNKLYMKATELYEADDKIGLYKICDELSIKYEIDENDKDIIEEKIQSIRKKINFIESTFTWKWFNTENELERERLILNFIELKIK